MRLYDDLATWWPLMSPPADYEEEATFYGDQLLAAGDEPRRTLLELGCGGGNNASFLKARFQSTTLVDLSPGMLAHSRILNPECEHHEGDMRTVRLGREFDRVFIQDAIMYMTSAEDLKQALETAFVHCRAGGAALVAPDAVKEKFKPSTECGGEDGPDRAIRYLEWCWDPDPSDCTTITDYVYALREPDGTTHVEHDRHVEGLFPRAEWLRLLTEVGFEAKVVPFEHSDLEPGSYEVFVAVKPRR